MSMIDSIESTLVYASDGKPALQVECFLEDGSFGRVSFALSCKDVNKAVKFINSTVDSALEGMDSLELVLIDRTLEELNDKNNQSGVYGNFTLPVSAAVACAASDFLALPVYQHLGSFHSNVLPVPMATVMSYGEGNEVLAIPYKASSFSEAVSDISKITQELKKYSSYAESSSKALSIVYSAVEALGLEEIVGLGLVSNEKKEELVNLITNYSIIYIETSKECVENLSDYEDRVQIALKNDHADENSAVVVNFNEFKTLSDMYEVIDFEKNCHYNPILDLGKVETEDAFFAQLVVSLGIKQIKMGYFCGSQVLSKYNELMRIEDELDSCAQYAGPEIFDFL